MPVGIDSQNAAQLTSASRRRSFLQRLTSFFVQLFECYTPDPYILAVGLTILTGMLAALFAPKGSLPTILTGWYAGLFSILAFAFQVLLILVAGYALSTSRPVRSATPGSSLNIVQKVTGQVLPLESMLFTPLNLVTTFVLFVALPLLYCAIQPGDDDVQIANVKE